VGRILLLLGLAAAVPVALAASVRSVTTPGPVTAVALDARLVAFAEGPSAKDCDRVRIWNLQTRAVTKLGRTTPCVQTTTGTGIANLSLAGGRVLWLHYTGGNIREWRLFTATRSTTKPKLLRSISRDVDLPSPIVVGNGDSSRFGDLLPYAVDAEVFVLRPDGSRRFSWRAPGRVVALSARFGELAVASTGGVVTVLDADGGVVRTERFAGEVTAVQLSGDGVLAQIGFRLDFRRGGATQTFALQRGARLQDAIGDRALFVVGQQVRQLSLATRVQRVLGAGADVDAQLSSVAIAVGRRATVQPLP
jgi:hypothetical protein